MCSYPFVTKARTLSPQALHATQAPPAPPLSPAVMALAAQFILFIMELMRILEQVAGETAAGYIRRHTPLDGALADLRAIVAGLPCPSSSDSESDDWESEESEFAEDWPGWLYPEPIPRADPASTPACAARMRSEIRACGPGNVEKAEFRRMPFHAHFITITQ
jgi:hypothetical protein